MKTGTLWRVAVGTAVCLLFLGGCAGGSQHVSSSPAKHSAKKNKEVSSRTEPAATQHSKAAESANKASSAKPKTLWSPRQAAALAAFMKSWGQSRGSLFRAYDQAHPVNYYGGLIPTEFAKMPPAMNHQKLNYALSEDGKANADYAIVAIYSDAETAGFGGQHVYLFTLYHGQPKVLVTMQNQGNAENLLYFDVTIHTDLSQAFAAIVAGEKPQQPETVGPNSPREAITQAEAANGNAPLAWEPVQSATDAETLLKQKLGDRAWTTVYGSVSRSAPVYWTVTEGDAGLHSMIVYATGEYKDYEW